MTLIYRFTYIAVYLAFRQIETYRKILLSNIRNAFLNLMALSTKENFSFLEISKPLKNYQNKNFILMDEFLVPQWVLVNAILAQSISESSGSLIATYGFNPRSNFSDSLFKSFSANTHFTILIKFTRLFRTLGDVFKVIHSVRVNDELKSLEIRRIRVGLDIYETILRTGTPTVQVGSQRYLRSTAQGIVALNFYEWLIKKKGLNAVLLSHDSYIEIGLLGKVAHQHQVPVYHANPYEIIRTRGNFEIYKRFLDYPSYFESLNEDSKKALLFRAANDLNRRLSGEVGIGLPHQSMSAFSNTGDYVFESKDNRKALIATHCFFDNPHAYDEMIFTDFWEWLNFLAENTKSSSLEWFIKPHRDYLPGTLETLEKLITKHPHLKILPSDTSFQYLKQNHFEVAFTCYGSIGHELPNLGIAVVNCAYNPHIAYNFNKHCTSKNEILAVLNELEESSIEIDVEGIYEFYAVHNYLMRPDDFFFPSMNQYQDYVTDPLNFDLCIEFIRPNWNKVADRFRAIIDKYLTQPEPNSTVYFLTAGKVPHD